MLAVVDDVVAGREAPPHAREALEHAADKAQEAGLALLHLQEHLGGLDARGDLAEGAELGVVRPALDRADVVVVAVGVAQQLLRPRSAGAVCRHGLLDRADLVPVPVDDERGDLRLAHLVEGAEGAGLHSEQLQHLGHHGPELPDHGQLQQRHDPGLDHQRGDALVVPRGQVHGAGRAQAAAVEDQDRRGAGLEAGVFEDGRKRLQHGLRVPADRGQPRLAAAPREAAVLGAEDGVEAAVEEGADVRLQVRAQLRVRVEVQEHHGPWHRLRAWSSVQPVRNPGAVAHRQVAVDPATAVWALLWARLALPRMEGDIGNQLTVPKASALTPSHSAASECSALPGHR
mmetsp:Transcript_12850/g.30441  ORF Transcript_12850/g.30441 Transcript_12850/m.30441 type:complete len:344 (+) Transcript_12850:96-1127(+)